jgi:hypothetical protein
MLSKMTLAMELKIPHISFRSRCVFLLALLTAAFGAGGVEFIRL